MASQNWERETLRGRLTTFRTFFSWAAERDLVEGDPSAPIGKVKPGVPNPRPVPDRIYLAALVRADETEALWIDLAAEHGLRRAEISVIHSRDIIETLLGYDLIVHGKGSKIRTIPLTTEMSRALTTRSDQLGGGYLFPGDDHGHLSPRWLGKRINRLLEGDWTIHKLRHRAGTRFWVQSGGDPYAVAELMGWSNLSMVPVYVKLPDTRLRSIVEGASKRFALNSRD